MVALVALVAFLVYGIYDAGKNERPPPSSSSTEIKLGTGHATGQRLRFRSWSADYDRIVSNADQTILDITGVRNGSIFKNGKPYLHVRAARLTVNTITRDFQAIGPLHIETVGTQPARTFDTTSATWSEAAQKLTFAQRVVIRSGADDPLTVGNLTLDIKTGNVAINDIDGPIRMK